MRRRKRQREHEPGWRWSERRERSRAWEGGRREERLAGGRGAASWYLLATAPPGRALPPSPWLQHWAQVWAVRVGSGPPGRRRRTGRDGQGRAQGTSTASWGLGGARNHGRPQVKCVAGGVRDENWRLTADTGGVKRGPRGAHISCVRGAGTRFGAQAGLRMRPCPHLRCATSLQGTS